MPVENASTIDELDNTLPLLGDGLNQTGAHIRQLKRILKDIFPGSSGNGFNTPIIATEDELDFTIGLTTNIQADLNLIGSNGVFVSGIVHYSGLFASIPAGWQLCDGSNGTPDLTDTFLYGTASQVEVGDTGGSADAIVVNHLHTMDHGHSVSITGDPDHTHTITSYPNSGEIINFPSISNAAVVAITPVTSNAGDHNHQVDINQDSLDTVSTGVSPIGANNPAYIRLAYIQRTS